MTNDGIVARQHQPMNQVSISSNESLSSLSGNHNQEEYDEMTTTNIHRIPPHQRMTMRTSFNHRSQQYLQQQQQQRHMIALQHGCSGNYALKLHHFLTHFVPAKGVEHIISWIPSSSSSYPAEDKDNEDTKVHANMFRVHNPEGFESYGFARMLYTSGYASFCAKLVGLGFTQIKHGMLRTTSS